MCIILKCTEKSAKKSAIGRDNLNNKFCRRLRVPQISAKKANSHTNINY